MALLDSEIYRIKAALGLNTLQIGAEPYVGVHPFFDIVRSYMQSGALTSSATTVLAATSPTLVTLTLSSATGFSTMARVWVDQDDAQETAMVESVNGSTISLRLTKAHSGTYPVTVDGGESIVRECLAEIVRLEGVMKTLDGTGALKKVDEVEFYQVGHAGTQFDALRAQIAHWTRKLGALFGVDYDGGAGGGCGSTCSVW